MKGSTRKRRREQQRHLACFFVSEFKFSFPNSRKLFSTSRGSPDIRRIYSHLNSTLLATPLKESLNGQGSRLHAERTCKTCTLRSRRPRRTIRENQLVVNRKTTVVYLSHSTERHAPQYRHSNEFHSPVLTTRTSFLSLVF